MYDLNQLPDINALGHYTNSNQTVIPDNKQMSMISTRPTLSQWLKKANTLPMTMNGTNMNGQERIKALVKGQPIVINIEDTDTPQKSNVNEHLHNWGKEYVDKYGNLIEKYAKQYNLDSNIAKAILYAENADFHKYGYNKFFDIIHKSSSVLPMNIQGKTWGNFQGRHYDVYDPEQNIELGIQVIKQIQNSIHNPTPEKVGTVWNRTGAMEVNDFGARTKTIYDNKLWEK